MTVLKMRNSERLQVGLARVVDLYSSCYHENESLHPNCITVFEQCRDNQLVVLLLKDDNSKFSTYIF